MNFMPSKAFEMFAKVQIYNYLNYLSNRLSPLGMMVFALTLYLSTRVCASGLCFRSSHVCFIYASPWYYHKQIQRLVLPL